MRNLAWSALRASIPSPGMIIGTYWKDGAERGILTVPLRNRMAGVMAHCEHTINRTWRNLTSS